MLLPQAKKDKLVRATDLDALSCRLSANIRGYFHDKGIKLLFQSYQQHLQFCEGYTQLSAGRQLRASFKDPKFPLINRGTYFRTEAINMVVERFIADYKSCQIVSMGGGSDTRGFRVLAEHDSVIYTEIDFPELVKIKKLAILNSQDLKKTVKCDISHLTVSSREEFEHIDGDLHTANYHLVGFDLRMLSSTGAEAFSFLDTGVPTLVISECVLCYLTPQDNERVLGFWKLHFARTSVVVYEPMGLGDAFGETMTQNLTSRGIDLHTFNKYPDLESRKHFMLDLGYSVALTDMALFGGYEGMQNAWIGPDELARVSKLEMVDEVEEIILLLKHYCLVCAESGGTLPSLRRLHWKVQA